jgi:23S rRNA pseudouridine2605 synthase
VLANAGAGSRREIERWIASGRVVVNGKPARLGDRLVGDERIVINGRRFKWPTRGSGSFEHLVYYKPTGEVVTRSDPQQRTTVFDRLPRPHRGRWISVGRLDVSTSGLILLTTDGELAHRLMHPSYEIQRRYAVRLLGELSEDQIRHMESGVALDDGIARVDDIKRGGGTGSNVWYEVSLREGRNREVRRMFEALGVIVSRLIRIRYGPIQLSGLRRGQSRPLTGSEVRLLYRAVELKPRRE